MKEKEKAGGLTEYLACPEAEASDPAAAGPTRWLVWPFGIAMPADERGLFNTTAQSISFYLGLDAVIKIGGIP